MTAPADEAELEPEKAPSEIDPDEDEELELPKKSKLPLIFVIVAVLLIGGGAGAYFTGLFHSLFGIEEGDTKTDLALGESTTVELPQVKADLKVGTCRSPFLRMQLNVQLAQEDTKRLEQTQEKIIEQIILHLRDQERQDLVGRAGADKLRFDLVNIINNVIAPKRIHGITFKEFILQ